MKKNPKMSRRRKTLFRAAVQQREEADNKAAAAHQEWEFFASIIEPLQKILHNVTPRLKDAWDARVAAALLAEKSRDEVNRIWSMNRACRKPKAKIKSRKKRVK